MVWLNGFVPVKNHLMETEGTPKYENAPQYATKANYSDDTSLAPFTTGYLGDGVNKVISTTRKLIPTNDMHRVQQPAIQLFDCITRLDMVKFSHR